MTRRGRTTITARALTRVATGLAADAAGVTATSADVSLADREGTLAARVTVPATIGDGRVLAEQGERIQNAFVSRMREVAGRHVAHVDIRFSGTRITRRKRVR